MKTRVLTSYFWNGETKTAHIEFYDTIAKYYGKISVEAKNKAQSLSIIRNTYGIKIIRSSDDYTLPYCRCLTPYGKRFNEKLCQFVSRYA